MKEKKNNSWMHGIILACIAFAVLMISFGIMASHHHIDLVVSDYYKEEINYQKQINKMNNYKALVQKPVIAIDSLNNHVILAFPSYKATAPLSGKVCFYRPDNQKYDDTIPLALNQAGIMDISLEKFRKGNWKMKLDWVCDQSPYYTEKSFKLK